jgi:glycosyltransferase involved in cell wall biosynthesis
MNDMLSPGEPKVDVLWSEPRGRLPDLRVAIVHDWFVVYAGAERVIEQMLRIFPQADLFAVIEFLPPELKGFILNKPVHTTFIQRLPKARTKYRVYLPLMPIAVEQLDLSDYDLVLSSSYAVAKGVLTAPYQLHVSYVHSPIRYAWDLQHQYLREARLNSGLKSCLARLMLHRMRIWDLRTANGVDCFVANSHFIRRRIQKIYRRDAHVIYPPVDVSTSTIAPAKENFYLTVSRMVPYKRIDLIVEAFGRMPKRRLLVIGEGPSYDQAKAKAKANVELLGFLPDAEVKALMQRARAFVFAAEEDFGITVLEAQAQGTPVIAYGRGGVTETVRGLASPRPTGVFFSEQSLDAIIAAVEEFETNAGQISSEACRENALPYSPERFRLQYGDFVENAWRAFESEVDSQVFSRDVKAKRIPRTFLGKPLVIR